MYKQINLQENKLYSKILYLSRNKLFFTKLVLLDTFQNRIYLIFLHVSFLFIKLKQRDESQPYKEFFQKMFDFIFNKIELNMREIGYGDMTINKNMKFLVKVFYNILLNCENYRKQNTKNKNLFLLKYLMQNANEKSANNIGLVEYFDKYQAFCFDLSLDSVLSGDLNFNYK